MSLHRPLLTSTTYRKVQLIGDYYAYTKFYCDSIHKLSDRCHLFYVIVDTTSALAGDD